MGLVLQKERTGRALQPGSKIKPQAFDGQSRMLADFSGYNQARENRLSGCFMRVICGIMSVQVPRDLQIILQHIVAMIRALIMCVCHHMLLIG